MSSTPHILSDSDSEVLCTEHGEPSILEAKEDEGFKNDWIHTVENEITRGQKLRKEKPSASRQKREYDVININFSKPYCNENYKRQRMDCTKKLKRRINPCLPRSSSKRNMNAHVLKEFNNRTKIKKGKKCPMRLAELAVPSKRQCIDTWRNKSYLLPQVMIERLKQHVMDQRPVVQIQDALYCFKRRKSQSSKKTFKNKVCDKTLQQPLRMMEARTLCAIFGHKIAETLRTPLNMSLGSNWDKISQVVAMDMAHIMYGRKNVNKANLINQSIHVEMSNKVTTWIFNILEDASYKLLLEDIKDLEEEEGPVLDFIDDLVANVVTICEPCLVQHESSSESSFKEEYDITEELCEIKTTPDTKSDIHEFDDSRLTDEEYFNNEITKIINNFDRVTEDEQESIEESIERLDDRRDGYENENIDEINEYVDDNRDAYENEAIQDQNDNIKIIDNPNIDNEAFDNTDGNERLDDGRDGYENEVIQDQNDNMKIVDNPNDENEAFHNTDGNESLDDGRDGYENEAIQDQNDNMKIVDNPNDNNEAFHNTDGNERLDDGRDGYENEAIQDQTHNMKIVDNPNDNNEVFNNTDGNERLDDGRDGYENEAIQDQNDNMKIVDNPNDDNEAVDNTDGNERLDDSRDVYESENIDEINEYVDNIRDAYENEALQDLKDNMKIIDNPNDDNEAFDNTDGDQVNLDFKNPEPNDLDIVEYVDANENNDSNVSEVFEIFSEEIINDDKHKTVKFSQIDMVNQDESKLLALSNTGHNLSEENVHYERPQVPREPYSDHKPNIVFAVPNEHLLSDADELWPSDLSSPSLKASESVSKSISSLGNIIETDEKYVTPSESEDKVEVTQEIGNQISEKIKNENAIHGFEHLVPSLIKMIEDTDFLFGDTDEKNVSIKKPKESNLSEEAKTKYIESPRTIIENKQSDEQLYEKAQVIEDKKNMDIKINKNMEESFCTTVEDMLMVETNKLINDEMSKVVSDLVEDKVWKVHPVAVPSWVFYGRGEPNENPRPNPITTIRDCDIRDWCKHLEGGFQNLELWTKWVDKIYQDINCSKYRIGFCVRCSCMKTQTTKKWTKLIKHINKETVLWINVFRSNQEKCKVYRRFYQFDKIKGEPTACCSCKCSDKNR